MIFPVVYIPIILWFASFLLKKLSSVVPFFSFLFPVDAKQCHLLLVPEFTICTTTYNVFDACFLKNLVLFPGILPCTHTTSEPCCTFGLLPGK